MAEGFSPGSIKVGGSGSCAVCTFNERQRRPQPVVATHDYKDKTYVFCSEAHKNEFTAEPGEFTGT